MSTKLLSGPVTEPITLDEAKEHLRVDIDDDNAYITSLITAARVMCEKYTRRAFITQQWGLYLDFFPKERFIEIPYPNLQSVEKFTVTDRDGVENTFDGYLIDSKRTPGNLVLKYDSNYPDIDLSPVTPIEINYTAGFGDTAADVPEPIKAAIKLFISHLYENREPVILEQGISMVVMPLSIESLLDPYRVWEV